MTREFPIQSGGQRKEEFCLLLATHKHFIVSISHAHTVKVRLQKENLHLFLSGITRAEWLHLRSFRSTTFFVQSMANPSFDNISYFLTYNFAQNALQ